MATIETIRESVRGLAHGAALAAGRSTVSRLLDEALRALSEAAIAAGQWGPDREHTCPGILCEAITGVGEKFDERQLGSWQASRLTDEQVSAATVERSRVDDSYLRMRAGGHEWLIRCEYDGAPDGTPVTYHVAACGEVSRG